MSSYTPWLDERWLPGVLNHEQMNSLVKAQIVTHSGDPIDTDASAMDLHLSYDCYEMIKGSIKPFDISYKEIIKDSYYAKKLSPDESDSFLLIKGQCYIFKIIENLNPCIKNFPIFGQATAKSTIGRVDVIARLVVDGMNEYEKFTPMDITSGEMFLEITPITFNVKLQTGKSISQLRFFYEEIENSIVSGKKFITSVLHSPNNTSNEGTLSVNLSNEQLSNTNNTVASAYRAKDKIDTPIELWKKKTESEKYMQKDFWDTVSSDEHNEKKTINIDPNRFYILRSKERISLNEGICIYCRAMDETLGEMRIHYAGFVHPFFGYKRSDGKTGTPLIFEVRGHNVKILLTHGEILARLFFYRMSKNAAPLQQNDAYNDQELKLSTVFQKNWD